MRMSSISRQGDLRCGDRIARSIAVVLVAAVLTPSSLGAADQWIEVKSANFTVVSNAGERGTRKLVWQFEQMRGALKALWAWTKPDLNAPLRVIVLKDEQSMRALAPEYWERRGGVRPASLWVSARDGNYLVVRTDVQADDNATINPYVSAYFSYAGLILDQSIDSDLPFWFRRGLTGLLSNTIVREDQILLGPVIPWYLQRIRDRPRLQLAKLMAIMGRSPELRQSDFLETVDATSWAFVHFLMFGEQGKRAPQLNAFVKLVSAGKDAATAFAETLGPVEPIEQAFVIYVNRNVFSYQRVLIDVSVERERFPVRPLGPAEASSMRAHFHAVMGRGVEARQAIAEARKAEPNDPGSYVAEGLILDSEEQADAAKAAFAKAASLGTSNAFVYYRLALQAWQPMPSRETLQQIEALLLKAVERNVRYAAAYAWLGDVRASLGDQAGLDLIRRAISLEPRAARHRLRAAAVLLNQGKAAEARPQAQAGLTLAEHDAERRDAEELLAAIAKAGRDVP